MDSPVFGPFVALAMLGFAVVLIGGGAPPIIRVPAWLYALGSGFFLVVVGCTWIASRLTDAMRARFEITIAILFPALASLYFLQETKVFELGIDRSRSTIIWLVPFWIIVWGLCIVVARARDAQVPVRAFLIAAAIPWPFIWMGHWDFRIVEDDPSSMSAITAQACRESLCSFAWYLWYVLLIYSALLFDMALRKRRKLA